MKVVFSFYTKQDALRSKNYESLGKDLLPLVEGECLENPGFINEENA